MELWTCFFFQIFLYGRICTVESCYFRNCSEMFDWVAVEALQFQFIENNLHGVSPKKMRKLFCHSIPNRSCHLFFSISSVTGRAIGARGSLIR